MKNNFFNIYFIYFNLNNTHMIYTKSVGGILFDEYCLNRFLKAGKFYLRKKTTADLFVFIFFDKKKIQNNFFSFSFRRFIYKHFFFFSFFISLVIVLFSSHAKNIYFRTFLAFFFCFANILQNIHMCE